MQPEHIKNKLIEELTGRSPEHRSGMIVGFFFAMGVIAAIGSGIYLWICIETADEPSKAGFLSASLGAIALGFVIGGIGSKMGILQAEIDDKALAALTRDEEDVFAEFGIKSWDYEQRRQQEMAATGFFLATFQFLFGTLWSCFEFLFLPSNLPQEGLRAATAVLMYLQQSGRTSQTALTQGLAQSGLPDQETRRGLAFLRTRGLVVGYPDGYILTEKAKKITQQTA